VVVGKSQRGQRQHGNLKKKYHQIAPPASHQKQQQQQQQQQQCPNIWHLLHTNRAVTQGHHLFYLKQFLLASNNTTTRTTTIFVSKSLPSSLWKRKEGLE